GDSVWHHGSGHLVAAERRGSNESRRSAELGAATEITQLVVMKKLRNARSIAFDELMPFSWVRFITSMLSYLLFCTDVARSGLGTLHLSGFTSLGPNEIMFYGPWAYSVNEIWKNETNGSVAVWSYKFDTTSIIWRAFGKYYGVDAFPSCFFYSERCADELSVVSTPFASSTRSARARATDPTTVTLRTKHVYYDVVHHHLLPRLFVPPASRTQQAVYYPPTSLSSDLDSICCHSRVRPNFCEDLWVNFKRSCSAADSKCLTTGAIGHDVMRRYRRLQTLCPEWQIDVTVLSSQDDAQVYSGGVTYMNKRQVDTSVILRALRCPPDARSSGAFRSEQCETMYVEDYRYEGGVATVAAPSWFYIVAPLRMLAQGYVYLRLVMLGVACYTTRSAEEKYRCASFPRKLIAAFLTFTKIPSQCIIYGSPFPIVCYVIAHIIDAPWTYAIVASKISTLNGAIDASITKFAVLAAIQMRNVWLLALAFQLFVYITTHRNWQPTCDVLGVSEYVLSMLSAITISSQYRNLKLFRDTRILSIDHIVTSTGRVAVGANIFNSKPHGNVLAEGLIIDFKMLSLLIILTIVVVGTLRWGRMVLPRDHLPVVSVLSRMAVPYSAGTLWSTVAVSVCWDMSVRRKTPSVRPSVRQEILGATSTKSADLLRRTLLPTRFAKTSVIRMPPDGIASKKASNQQSLQYQLSHIHERTEEVHAWVALINLVTMSDPWTFLFLKVLSSHEVCVLECEDTKTVFLLPLEIVQAPQDMDMPWVKTRLLQVVNTKDMNWSDLIHCG
ncbi:TPA: hypothetical protein N0F65_007000, partial [Lagenidium giganteum]